MISMIIPSYNRSYTLKLVAPSYYAQDGVTEILFVLDGCTDDSPAVLKEIADQFPHIETRIMDLGEKVGATRAKNIGIAAAKNDYIMMCDDDQYIEKTYALTCKNKFETYENVGVIAGRNVYMRDGETPEEAVKRFGDGITFSKPFLETICEYVNGARFKGDLCIPVVNANIFTRKDRFEKHSFDPFYSQGNGYREETDFQMSLYMDGYNNYTTSDCHTIHLPLSKVKRGGQRVKIFKRVYWSMFYTNYFFGKFYKAYAKKRGIKTPQSVAMVYFFFFYTYREVLRPYLRDAVLFVYKLFGITK